MKQRIIVVGLVLSGVIVILLGGVSSFTKDWTIGFWLVGLALFILALVLALTWGKKKRDTKDEIRS